MKDQHFGLIEKLVQFSEAMAQGRRAIDKVVAIRLAMETLNGMAKMAPVLPRHIRELASKAS